MGSITLFDAPRMKQTLTTAGWVRLETAVKDNPVLDNAFRLVCDADLLIAHGRSASALALAVLAMEEIGKYLLSLWSEDNAFEYDKKNLHKMKQGAVAMLFMADQARKECKARSVDFSDLGTSEKMENFARATQAGVQKDEFFAGSVLSGVIEVVKHSGLYYDEKLVEKGIEPSRITADSAAEIMRMCSRAFMTLTDERSVSLAKEFFQILIHKKDKGSEGCEA